jgi:hypothetical protein
LHEDFLALDRVSLTQKQMKKNLDRDSALSRDARFPQLRRLAWSGDYLKASRGYHLTRSRIQDPSNNLTWQPVAVYRPGLRRRAFEAGCIFGSL